VGNIQRYVNGGVYSIEFRGRAPEFNGIHPAVIIRTLKERDLYIVIPLTTYTKERWDKTKRYGFGMRILETNSIAKIDKYKVVHKNAIRNKWVNQTTGRPVILAKESFAKLSKKFTEYNKLSGSVAEKEYNKYVDLLENVDIDFRAIVNLKEGTEYSGIFEIQTDSTTELIYRCEKSKLNMLSIEDIHLIVNCYIKTDDINISGEYLIINCKKPIDKKEDIE
jgi:hypothetical protein